VRLLLM